MKRLIALTLMFAVIFVSQSAYADKKKVDIDKLDFNDEKLVDPNLSADQASIMTRQAPVRTVLVRPRISFIAELVKTIENL